MGHSAADVNSLSAMLAGRDRVNLLITGKHPGSGFAPYTFRDELTHGAAVWPHMGNGTGPPDIVLASAGRRQRRDAPASNTISAAAVDWKGSWTRSGVSAGSHLAIARLPGGA
ncbi:hypothetical protein ACIBSV_36055 [Embleya sp. NPDC050154]|uniref:hypothetical protein n=1 Tax=Embleya sp. NPDC050154 TaxID=3363988 RepID=UPI0037A648C9